MYIRSDVIRTAVDVEIEVRLLYIAIREGEDGRFVVGHAILYERRFRRLHTFGQRQFGHEFILGERTAVEDVKRVGTSRSDETLNLYTIHIPNINELHLVEERGLLSIEGILHKGRLLYGRTFLAAIAREELVTLDCVELFLLEVRHEKLAVDEVHDLIHILILTGDGDVEIRVVATIGYRSTELRNLLVEILTLDSRVTHDTCVLHKHRSVRKKRHLVLAHSITEDESEDIIFSIRRVVERYVLAQRRELHVVEVVEGLFEFALRQFLELLSVLGLRILHRIKRFDIRLRQRFRLHILGILVEGDGHVVGIEIFLCYARDLLFGEGLNLLVSREDIIYRLSVGESVHEDGHLGRRRLVEGLVLLCVHVLYVRDEFIGDLAPFDLIDLLHDDGFGSLIGLEHLLVGIIVRHRHDDQTAVVTARVQERISLAHVTLGVDLVEETCLAVVKEVANKLQYILILVTLFDTLIDPSHLRVITEVVVLLSGQFDRRIGRTCRQFFRLQTSESLSDHRLGGLGIEVSDDDERHVVRYVPCVVELNQTRETRVLEVLGQTDDVTLVRRTFVDILHKLLLRLGRRVVGVHVVLLEHVLQLCLESTEDRVDETVGEDRQPAVHLCSRERVVVRREVVRRIGVHALSTDEVEHVEEILG